ncbi:hypothetical protein HHK36_027870 [Tetracentron sinense]|uniref:Cytochrome P450 n=1 Tax=Tetracentron sinense TaxID=13715 RepID=A0A834YJY9_TETSI|nr:hypothetical protein HHK36_027870 [Tetracentron sinense]
MELFTSLFCASLAFFFIRALLQLSQNTKLPPGPTGLPIVGCLFKLGERPNESLAELAKTHGPLMTLRLGSVTTVVVSSAQMAKEIFYKNDQSFSDRVVPDVITAQPNYEATLAWVPGNSRWRNRRRVCNTWMFTTQKLDALQELRHKKVQELVDHLSKSCLARTSVDVGETAFATTLNLMSNTIFSVDLVDPKFESAQEFKDLVWRIMEDAGKPNLSDYFPLLRRFDLQGVKRHIKPSYVRLHEIFDEVIDKRMGSRSAGSIPETDDFLDVLLDQCQEDGSGFTRQTIKPLFVFGVTLKKAVPLRAIPILGEKAGL